MGFGLSGVISHPPFGGLRGYWRFDSQGSSSLLRPSDFAGRVGIALGYVQVTLLWRARRRVGSSGQRVIVRCFGNRYLCNGMAIGSWQWAIGDGERQ